MPIRRGAFRGRKITWSFAPAGAVCMAVVLVVMTQGGTSSARTVVAGDMPTAPMPTSQVGDIVDAPAHPRHGARGVGRAIAGPRPDRRRSRIQRVGLEPGGRRLRLPRRGDLARRPGKSVEERGRAVHGVAPGLGAGRGGVQAGHRAHGVRRVGQRGPGDGERQAAGGNAGMERLRPRRPSEKARLCSPATARR